jgi:2-polyprenyl-3-methyl-5-hydroxy-6-metoxy-1,4-benzoquinol methylase
MIYKCNTCESEKSEQLFKVDKQIVVKCTNCDLVYLANPMKGEETITHYENEYYSGSDNTASSSCYNQGAEFRLKEARDRLDKIGNIDSLLDVGCGMGFFVKAASERGIKACGIDISKNAVDYGKSQGLDLRQADLLFLNDIRPQSIDLITFWASIEHLYLPKETLQKAYQLLKPEGSIIIETGNFDSYQSKLFGNKWRLITTDHNFYYSSKNLDELLNRTGFLTVYTENDGFVESTIAQLGLRDRVLNRFAQSSGKSKEKSSSLKEKINGFASKLTLGDVMIKYARKKLVVSEPAKRLNPSFENRLQLA